MRKKTLNLSDFKFYPKEWQDGSITSESYELQGLFISVCAFYWAKNCNVTLVLLNKRFKDYKEMLMQLIDLDILKYDSKSGVVRIKFLDEQ